MSNERRSLSPCAHRLIFFITLGMQIAMPLSSSADDFNVELLKEIKNLTNELKTSNIVAQRVNTLSNILMEKDRTIRDLLEKEHKAKDEYGDNEVTIAINNSKIEKNPPDKADLELTNMSLIERDKLLKTRYENLEQEIEAIKSEKKDYDFALKAILKINSQ